MRHAARTDRRAANTRQVFGARKVWGTHKSATTGEVKGAISILANIPANDLTVKRKFKVVSGNRRAAKWWFVLRSDENVLKKLEETWSTIALPWRWKLEPLFCYAEADSGTRQLQTPDTNRSSSGDYPLSDSPGATQADPVVHAESTETSVSANVSESSDSDGSMTTPNPTDSSNLPTPQNVASQTIQ